MRKNGLENIILQLNLFIFGYELQIFLSAVVYFLWRNGMARIYYLYLYIQERMYKH